MLICDESLAYDQSCDVWTVYWDKTNEVGNTEDPSVLCYTGQGSHLTCQLNQETVLIFFHSDKLSLLMVALSSLPDSLLSSPSERNNNPKNSLPLIQK